MRHSRIAACTTAAAVVVVLVITLLSVPCMASEAAASSGTTSGGSSGSGNSGASFVDKARALLKAYPYEGLGALLMALYVLGVLAGRRENLQLAKEWSDAFAGARFGGCPCFA
jgi:hypothetical protein